MSLSRLASRSCKSNEGKGDYFDLLGLPDEIIDHVFSFLDVRERFRMRLNKRLSKIESTSKYYVERVDLYQLPYRKCVFIKNRRYPLDFLIRIAHNSSIEQLHVRLGFPVQLNSKFIDLIKEFTKIEELVIHFEVGTTGNLREIMSDSLFLDLTGRCEDLTVCYLPSMMNIISISPKSFRQVYKSMNDGKTCLRKLAIHASIDEENLNGFLNLLEIAYRNGRIISSRNIEAYKDHLTTRGFYVNIFDGFFHISFFYQPDLGGYYRDFKIELHQNLESLNKAKSADSFWGREWTRMDVYSE